MKNDQTNLPADPLDALLREADDYVPDNGFTARVIKNLPARRRRNWIRFAILSAALLIGAGLFAWQLVGVIQTFGKVPNSSALWDWRYVIVFCTLLAVVVTLGWGVFAIANDED